MIVVNDFLPPLFMQVESVDKAELKQIISSSILQRLILPVLQLVQDYP